MIRGKSISSTSVAAAIIGFVAIVFFVWKLLNRRGPTQSIETDRSTQTDYPPKLSQILQSSTPQPSKIRDCDDKQKRDALNQKYRESESRQEEGKWKKPVFIDCETTGLEIKDRIVSFSAILLDLTSVDGAGQTAAEAKFLHLAFNPERTSHQDAMRVHGLSTDFLLQHPLFREEAVEIRQFIEQGNLLVAHNVKFDLRILNEEFKRAGMPPLEMETCCTMETWRKMGLPGSASLRSISKHLGHVSKSTRHSSLEDVCLCVRVFAHLTGLKINSFEWQEIGGFQNTPEHVSRLRTPPFRSPRSS